LPRVLKAIHDRLTGEEASYSKQPYPALHAGLVPFIPGLAEDDSGTADSFP